MTEYDWAKDCKASFDLCIDSLRERLERSKVVIGDAVLFNEDCEFVLPTLGKVDAVVTDPPYGMNALDGSRTKRLYGDDRRKNWDVSPPSLDLMNIVLSSAHYSIVWGSNYLCNNFPPHKCFLVWNKPHVAHLRTRSSAEVAFTNLDRPAETISMVADIDRDHPTQKPLRLMRWCLSLLPDDAETILDPFMGSGTTGVACAKMGRKFIGIEREKKYFDIACRRIEDAYKQPDMFIEAARPKPEQFDLLGERT
jgi:site-specific DNA-methyltransferase (adenine-specific)